jgi:hypothetical protein
MDPKEIDREYHHYLDKFQKDAELGSLLNRITYQELFNEKFLKENSQFKSLDELTAKSGFRHREPGRGGKAEPGQVESVHCGEHQRPGLVPVRQAGHDRVDENGHRAP